MVNFPSRPNSRPAASPRPCGVRRHDAALELGDMSPSTSHRLVYSARNQTKSNHPASASRHRPPFAYFAFAPCLPDLRNPRPEPDSPPIKAKPPAIVPDQG